MSDGSDTARNHLSKSRYELSQAESRLRASITKDIELLGRLQTQIAAISSVIDATDETADLG